MVIRVDDLLATPRVGTSGNDVMFGTPANDYISGLAGNDRLHGLAGDDRLDGGAGADIMVGGAGDDVYVFDNTGDAASEIDAAGNDSGGIDEIQTSVNLILPSHVERVTMTGADPLTVWGSANDDTIVGNGGDNGLYGLEGADRMAGGAGDDSYAVDNAGDVVIEQGGEGLDRVFSTVSLALADNAEELWLSSPLAIDGTGNDLDNVIHGSDADNTLVGLDGNDTLDGAGGADRMLGGAGDDLYIVADEGDTVVETPGEGIDAVQSTIGFTLPAEVENLQLVSDAGLDGRGNALANVITGSVGDDSLDGAEGDDTLEGSYGSDTYVLAPGGGRDNVSDVLYGADRSIVAVDAAWRPADVRIDREEEGGHDWLVVSAGPDGDALRFQDYADIPYDLEVRFADGSIWDAATVRRMLIEVRGTEGDDVLYGRSRADELYGFGGNDVLQAGAGDDRLEGGDGDDTLDGGAGDDVMTGGAGGDIYVLDGAGDRVYEYAGEGADTVMSPLSYALFDEFENLTLTGSDAIDGTGNLQDNRIVGNVAANTLDGGWGDDWLAGGSGDDTYAVDSTRDAVVEALGEGHDLVLATDSFTLGANVEDLTLTGAGWIDGTGNELDNVITGNDGPNRLDGGAGADTLRGGVGDDIYVVDSTADIVIENAGEGSDAIEAAFSYTLGANLEQLRLLGSAALDATGNGAANTLVGNAGNNRLDGAAGADVMRGGAGNDIYIVDSAGDLAVENASEGADTVQSAISFVLPANVESLLLTGTAAINGSGNALANTITGNAAANRLDGGAGADTLTGKAGNDVYIVDNAGDVVSENVAEGTDLVQASVSVVLAANVENLTLTGSAAINATGNTLANALTGNTASNRLDGKLGADRMSGGAGNDTYVVDQSGDTVTEGASAGVDTIESGISWALGANVENLTLTGTAAINGTGNALANVLAGNAGANRLDGAAGADTMKGGAGDDVYIVDNAADITTEAASAGNDLVQTSVSWTLAANTENLTLTGAAAINGTGNALGNALFGNDAANALNGGDGADLLWGAAGNDALQGGVGNDVLQGGAGDDTLADAYGNALFDGGTGADVLTGGGGRDIFVGGAGADTITTGGGADIVAFNRGGGADAVNASTGSDDTLSLGGGIAYADLRLRKSGLDLVLDAGAGDQITLRNWYQTGVNNKSVVNLQMVADAMAGFNAAGADRLLNKRVTNFNFAGIVGRFDAALAANPALTSFDVSSALGEFYLSGSDSAAIGGDLAYGYGHRNALTDIGMIAAQTVIGSAAFGTSAQSLQAPGVLYSGGQRLR